METLNYYIVEAVEAVDTVDAVDTVEIHGHSGSFLHNLESCGNSYDTGPAINLAYISLPITFP